MEIPLSIPNLGDRERQYLLECLDTNFVSSVGQFVSKFETQFAEYVGAKHAIAVMNGTAALHLALKLVGVKADEEVLVNNLTFIAPVNAIHYLNAHPVLIDACWDNLGMDVNALRTFLQQNAVVQNGVCKNKTSGRRIRAILPVHILGNGSDIQTIVALAKEYSLEVVEDACECLGARLNKKSFGTFGKMGCFSFNGNKVITSGGGGMIVTDDPILAKRAKHLSTTAKTDDLQFEHDEVGYNYRMVNVLAAIGLAQLERIDNFLQTKRVNFERYLKKISRIPGLSLHVPAQQEQSNYWFYSLLVEKEFPLAKDRLMHALIERGIQVRPIWRLMEDLPMSKACQKTSTSVSREIYDKVLNIPCSTSIGQQEIDIVTGALEEMARKI